MKDVSPEDRPTSYIITFSHNPVLERLYDEVGIKTICLDRDGKAQTSLDRTNLLSEFLTRLATVASHDGHIPGQQKVKLFYSTALTEGISRAIDEHEQQAPRRLPRRAFSQRLDILIAEAARRSIPSVHQSALADILAKAYSVLPGHSVELVAMAVNYLKQFGPQPMVTAIIARAIEGQPGRDFLTDEQLDWRAVWATKIPESTLGEILQRFDREISGHQEEGITDHDLAFCCDVTKRIVLGQIFDSPSSSAVKRANALLSQAAQLYTTVQEYTPITDKFPDVSSIIGQIDERALSLAQQTPAPDDIPF